MPISSRTIPIRSDKLTMSFSVLETLCDEQSQFQQITVLSTEVFGDVLLLDGHIQLSTFDEAAYHELLVRLPANSISDPKRVLIIGGGDGGALREALKINGIERVTMVEIDEQVIALSRQHLPTLSAGAFDDPRSNVIIGDAFAYVQGCTDHFDLIIVDSTDIYEEEVGELSAALWTEAFYHDLLGLLSPGGIVVTQADNAVFCGYSVKEVSDRFAKVFTITGTYAGLVPSFGGVSAFVYGSQDQPLRKEFAGGDHRYLSPVTYALALDFPSFGR
ncbi:MAG: polyamine aminopropyltransferase [Armatimonadota bacterium]